MTTPGRRAPAGSEESNAAGATTLPGVRLTPREIEVLDALADGLTNQEISDRLGIYIRTTANHLTNVYRKLGVDSRTEAVAVWSRPDARVRDALEHVSSALAGATVIVGHALDQLRETP